VRTLLAGWFSFEQMGATAGDLMTRDLARQWLEDAGHQVDVALAPPFEGGVSWNTVDPQQYEQIVFVCGPLGNGWPVYEFFDRFQHARKVGLNVSMLQPLEDWNPFDLLLERDSSRTSNAELAFLSNEPKIPVVGLVLVHPQKEYADPKHEAAHAAIDRLLSAANVSTVPIDTRLDDNTTGWRNAAQVESLIAKTDVVVTTRLHGTVLALKNGVPALVIDPIAGGAKIRRQCATIGWPLVFDADELDDAKLAEAFAYCLTKAARIAARACAARATAMAEGVRDRFREDARHAENSQKKTRTEAR